MEKNLFSVKRNKYGRILISFKNLTLRIQHVSMLLLIIGALIVSTIEGDSSSLLGGVIGLPISFLGLVAFLYDKDAEEKEKNKQ